LRGKVLQSLEKVPIYPGSHYVTFPERTKMALVTIREELKERLEWFRSRKQFLEVFEKVKKDLENLGLEFRY
jgi:excinuclease ABC subunit B